MATALPTRPDKFAGDLIAFLPHLQLDADGKAAFTPCETVMQAITTLEMAGLLIEATRLAAHALPAREAVWWACMCARHTAASGADPQNEAVTREAAEEWVRRQTDEIRRAAMDRAHAVGFRSPEAWAAIAAFWSGDTMAPAAAPKVPPEPHFRGLAVAGSVALAAARGDVRRRDARLKQFLSAAREIATGGAGRLDEEAV